MPVNQQELLIKNQKIRLWTQRLYQEYEQLCYQYSLKLKKPLIRIDPLEKRWGFWDSELRLIGLAERLIENHCWENVIEIFKHEIAHQIVSEIYREEDVHGLFFQKACDLLGVLNWARKAETQDFPHLIVQINEKNSDEEKRILQRAEKLLSLASSDNEHEALLAMQKVQELYTKYNLKKIQDQSSRKWAYTLIKFNKKRVERYQSAIASLLNDFFFVEVIHTTQYDQKKCEEFKALEILGDFENVQMADYVYHFLENRLNYLWSQYKGNRKLSLASKNSFYLGVLRGFRCKAEEHQKLVDEKVISEGCKQSLVTLKTNAGLQAWVKTRYPRLSRLGGGHRLHDSKAFSQGEKEGRNLVIHKPISTTATFFETKLLKK